MSLDVLGAGEGLGTKNIVLRVKSIDTDRLRQKLGGMSGAAIPAALPLIDQAPEIALRTALPLAAKKARDDYGVDLEWDVRDATPGTLGKSSSGFGAGVMVGIICGVAATFAWKAF